MTLSVLKRFGACGAVMGLMVLMATSVWARDNERGGFSVGASAGYTNWGADSPGVEYAGSRSHVDSNRQQGGAFGVVARYDAPCFGDSKFFCGVEASWQGETVFSNIAQVTSEAGIKLEVDWSADMMVRLGRKLEIFSPRKSEIFYPHATTFYASAGLSLVGATVRGTGILQGGRVSEIHQGWKAALGSDFQLTREGDWGGFLQLEYARYGSKTYTHSGYDVQIKIPNPDRVGVRMGVMYHL